MNHDLQQLTDPILIQTWICSWFCYLLSQTKSGSTLHSPVELRNLRIQTRLSWGLSCIMGVIYMRYKWGWISNLHHFGLIIKFCLKHCIFTKTVQNIKKLVPNACSDSFCLIYISFDQIECSVMLILYFIWFLWVCKSLWGCLCLFNINCSISRGEQIICTSNEIELLNTKF